ncbi:MAG: hypothetical protein EP330_08585 [Deltaproteobacteria bacterium]|nr:MAG: hypothetical protein EP330_08585 [Deltaproteobacteria bacterium]
MDVTVRLAFSELASVRLLNWLARENANIHRSTADLPLLYDAKVVYQRERGEVWCDVLSLYQQGHEDCDGLAAARAGEILAHGWKALRPGDAGFELARQLRPTRVRAEVLITTRDLGPALYHCIVRYRLGGRWFRDDPSARLGMNGAIDPAIRRRWAA